MRLLLDTHSLLWILIGHSRISPSAKSAVYADTAEVFYSPVSLYELEFKANRGRAPAFDLPKDAVDSGFIELTLTTEHILHAARIDWSHGDPWDRIVLAQAMLEDMRLVSVDHAFDTVTDRRLW